MSRLQKKPAAHKRGHPTLQNENFFSFCGSFLPSWIRIRIPNTDPDPDPLARLNTDPIRIRIRILIRIRNPGCILALYHTIIQCGGSALVSMRIRMLISFLPQFGSGSKVPNTIRILADPARNKRTLRRYKSLFEMVEIRLICNLWSISFLLDPDPDSQNRSGSGRAKSMRFRIQNTAIIPLTYVCAPVYTELATWKTE